MRCLPLLLCTALLAAESLDVEAEVAHLGDLLAALPEPPAAALREGPPPQASHELAAGVAVEPGRFAVLAATSLIDQGPVDGLEVLACLRGGKNHESFAWLESGNAQLVASALLLLEPAAGVGSAEMSSLPARGTPLMVTVHWQPDRFLEPDRWVWAHASQLVRDRRADRAYPPLPYIYTGSRILPISEPGPDGQVVERDRFMLEVTKSVAVNFDEPDALLASPSPLAAQDDAFEVNSALAPAPKTPLRIAFRPASLPLELALAADGALSRDGTVLDDQALANQLATAFSGDDEARLQAVAVRVAATTSRLVDVAARRRLLAAAATAGVWAVPIFVPGP